MNWQLNIRGIFTCIRNYGDIHSVYGKYFFTREIGYYRLPSKLARVHFIFKAARTSNIRRILFRVLINGLSVSL